MDMDTSIINIRVNKIDPLVPPSSVRHSLPLTESVSELVRRSRIAVSGIIDGHDDRLLCIVGPCSVHNPKEAIAYAIKLRHLIARYENELFIVMRTYVEKPRTVVGWKGLVNDPALDNTCDVNRGLFTSRLLLRDIVERGVPCAVEFLDTIVPQYLSELVSWGAIGARTVESQLHRELVSGLSMPVGFKNSTSGNSKVALDAIVAARRPHSFIGVTQSGMVGIVRSSGNPHTHIVCRGGCNGPNYDEESINSIVAEHEKRDVRPAIIVDCSHANSGKNHLRQPAVAAEVARQIISRDDLAICGVMIESNICAGKQSFVPAVDIPSKLLPNVSITDSCVDIDTTDDMLYCLAKAVKTRRSNALQKNVD